MKKQMNMLKGQTFYRLTVLDYAGKNKHLQNLWLCSCSCGNTTTVISTKLTSKNNFTQSCGCLHRETIKKQQLKSKTHGYSKTHKSLYNIYFGMLARCNNSEHKDYKYYGGKGVKVVGWATPAEFVEWGLSQGYEQGLTIDRINSQDNYSRENCQWVTRAENTRRKHNVS